MDITRIAIDKTRITYTALAVIFLSGLGAYFKMPRSQDPGFIVRTAMITTYFPGAGPERVEKLVTDPLEKAIQEMPELDVMRSTSKTGVSIIYVDIKEQYKDMRPIWDSLRRKVDRERGNLPEGVSGPIVNDEFGDVFGIIVGIIGDGFSFAEMKLVADQVRDELLLSENVAKVDIIGAQEERIFLEYNNARLAQLGLTPYQLRRILAEQNIVIPGGSLRIDEERLFLEPTGNFESIAELENLVVALPGGAGVTALKDLVVVNRGYVDPPRHLMYSSGLPALGLAVSMRKGGNIIDLGTEVKAGLDRLAGSYPIGIEFEILAFEPEAVAATISNFTGNLLQAVFVVMLTMVIFLGLRTGLVVASLIPAAILATFLCMGQFDIGLDKISLAALIISLGLLVDNAIVMSESCLVLMGEGMSGRDAAIQSARELRVSLLTSSLTTAAAFLPIYLAKSSTGEYTAGLFKVVTISLLCSWLMALTLIPLLCAGFLKAAAGTDAEHAYQSRFYKTYRRLLVAVLRRPVVSLVAVIAMFFVSLQGFRYIDKAFFPGSDQPMCTIKMALPLGTAIEETDRVMRQVDAYITAELKADDTRGGITTWSSYVGEGAPRFYLSYAPEPPSPNFGFLLLNVSDYRLIPKLTQAVETYVTAQFPDVKVDGQALPNGPPVTHPIEVRLSGRDTGKLFDMVRRVKEQISAVEGTRNVDDDWGLRNKKLLVEVNQARARRAGVTSQDVAISLQTMLSGVETTQFREDDKTIPIVLRSVASDRHDLDKLEQLSVYGQAGGTAVPLRQIAEVRVVWEPPEVKRRNRMRTVVVSAKLAPGITPTEVEQQFVPQLREDGRTWPPGYRYELGGENQKSSESQASIGDQLPVAAMIILLLLVGQFNSMRRPLIILGTLPLAVVGVVIGLLATGASLGFMSFLGIISLFGIVINNAIVLIDRIDLEINELGRDPARAVIEAGQRRLRPILLTTITTLAGLIPLWTGGGPMFQPMAITIIFGLAFATVLTLGLVPLLYALFFRVRFDDYVADQT